MAQPGVRQGVRDPLIDEWWAREVGSEDSLETQDLVTAFIRPERRISLRFVLEQGEPPRVELLTRENRRWALEWSGALPRCP